MIGGGIGNAANSDIGEKVISRFAEAAIGERPWRESLREIADCFRASCGLVAIHDGSGQAISFDVHGYSHEEVAAFFQSEAWTKGWIPSYSAIEPGQVYCNGSVPGLDKNPWFRECLHILNVGDQLGVKLRLPNGGLAALVCLRTAEQGHPNEDDIASFHRIAPQLEAACATGFLLEREAATRESLLQALVLRSDGVILLDVHGMPVFMNDAAAAILNKNDGLGFRNGEFWTARSVETRLIRKRLAEAASSFFSADLPDLSPLLITRPSGKKPYVLRIYSAPPSERLLTRHAIATIVHIKDLADSARVKRQTLKSLFGLTERECDLCLAFLCAVDLEAAAGLCGMALNTARNHLQGIFRKTGTANQAHLMQLCARLT